MFSFFFFFNIIIDLFSLLNHIRPLKFGKTGVRKSITVEIQKLLLDWAVNYGSIK